MAVAALASGSYVSRGGRAARGGFAVAVLSPRGRAASGAFSGAAPASGSCVSCGGKAACGALTVLAPKSPPSTTMSCPKLVAACPFAADRPFSSRRRALRSASGQPSPARSVRGVLGRSGRAGPAGGVADGGLLRVSARDSVGDLPVSVATWRMAFSSAKPSLATSAVERLARSVTTLGRSPDTLTSAEIGDAAAADTGVDLAVAGVGAGEVGDAGASSIAAIARNSLRRSPRRTPIFSRS